MTGEPLIVFYLLPLGLIWGTYMLTRRRGEARAISLRDEAREAGLTEPASLHPVFDPSRCMGCKACVNACPEGDILGVINGKALLVEPANCIGHGACKAACPTGAIELVYGNSQRGVDIPNLHPNFETNVPGIFIAGELGGMGLIRNAIEQGRQAMDSIARLDGLGRPDRLDVVIVGGGPAGISASLAAIEKKLRFVTLEQDTLGGTVAHFPRGKVVMTAPARLPIVGKIRFKEVSKETLLAFWQKVARDTDLEIRSQERVVSVAPTAGGFSVKTEKGLYHTRAVLLAIGRRGTPRRLGVPGEESPKVLYRLVDPEQFRGRHVLVVGGGDSALEAAASLSEVTATTVTLSYRGEAFQRAKQKNRARVNEAVEEKRLRVLLSSQIKRIWHDRVEIEVEGRELVIENDAIIVCAGGVLPTAFLKSIGIGLETKYGTA